MEILIVVCLVIIIVLMMKEKIVIQKRSEKELTSENTKPPSSIMGLSQSVKSQTLPNNDGESRIEKQTHITSNFEEEIDDNAVDLSEKGYYNRIISGNIQQRIEIDSVSANFDSYPYQIQTFAKQFIYRSSNLTKRSLITSCMLVNSVRSDNNPQGFTMEKFNVIENKDLETVDR